MKFSKVLPSIRWRTVSPWLLGACWLTGLALGSLAAGSAGNILVPLMRESVRCSPSIAGLLVAALLPFLLSALAVSLSEPWLLLIISTFKAFSFSFCACGVSLAFGQSGWLVRFLFLFSDLCQMPVLYLYWLRHIKGNCGNISWEFPACLCAVSGIGCIDYCLIAPFLVSIMDK